MFIQDFTGATCLSNINFFAQCLISRIQLINKLQYQYIFLHLTFVKCGMETLFKCGVNFWNEKNASFPCQLSNLELCMQILMLILADSLGVKKYVLQFQLKLHFFDLLILYYIYVHALIKVSADHE